MSDVRKLHLVTDEGSMDDTLACLDDLKEAVRTGRVKAFAAVGIDREHGCHHWCGSTAHTTNLEMVGAIASLLHDYQHERLTE